MDNSITSSREKRELISITGLNLYRAIRKRTNNLKREDQEDSYFDFDLLAIEPALLERIVDLYVAEIKELLPSSLPDFLTYIDRGSSGYGDSDSVGAIMLASALTLKTFLPYFLIQPSIMAQGERVKTPRGGRAVFKSLKDNSGIIITDHVSTGDEVLNAASSIKYLDGNITNCIAFTCSHKVLRKQEFEKQGIELTYFHALPYDAQQPHL